jgi:hypothetical protein
MKTRLMEIKREFEITYSYEYDERLERRNSFFFFTIERRKTFGNKSQR